MGMPAPQLWPVYPASCGEWRMLFHIGNLEIWILGYLWLKSPRLKLTWEHGGSVVSGQIAVLEHYPPCWSWKRRSLQKSMQRVQWEEKKKIRNSAWLPHSLMQKANFVPSIFCRGVPFSFYYRFRSHPLPEDLRFATTWFTSSLLPVFLIIQYLLIPAACWERRVQMTHKPWALVSPFWMKQLAGATEKHIGLPRLCLLSC